MEDSRKVRRVHKKFTSNRRSLGPIKVAGVTEGLPDDEWGFRSGRCFLDKIFTLKQIVRKNVCRFYGLRERV